MNSTVAAWNKSEGIPQHLQLAHIHSRAGPTRTSPQACLYALYCNWDVCCCPDHCLELCNCRTISAFLGETSKALTLHTNPEWYKQALLALDNQQCKVQVHTLLGGSGCLGIIQHQASPCLALGSQVFRPAKNGEAGSRICRTLCHCNWCYQL